MMAEDKNKAQLEKLTSNDEALLAETVFQVAHYNDEYESAASTADVSFELTEADEKVHREVMDAYKLGYDVAETSLGVAESEGLIEKDGCGGWIVTDAGLEYLEEHSGDLGNTFESKKHGGEAEVESDAELGDVDEIEEEPTEDEIEEEMEIEEIEPDDDEQANVEIDEGTEDVEE